MKPKMLFHPCMILAEFFFPTIMGCQWDVSEPVRDCTKMIPGEGGQDKGESNVFIAFAKGKGSMGPFG